MSQNGPKTTLLMSFTKYPQPNQNIFFRLQTRRLADPFEPLMNSLAQSAEELWRWSGNRKQLVLGQNLGTNISYASSQSVNLAVKVLVNLFHKAC